MTYTSPRSGPHAAPGHWTGPAAVLVVGCAIAWVLLSFGLGAPVGVAIVAVSIAVAAWNSPLRSVGHEPWRSVHGRAGSEPTVVVLWRPGCPYSAALRRGASREGLRVHWVNIWRDAEAHALCRRINKGSEETPTAILLEPGRTEPVVIPASVPGIREATSPEPGAGGTLRLA